MHCFSCGYHYDALEFYKVYKQVSNAKALEELSVIYGFKIKKKEAVRNEEEKEYCFDLDAEGREYLKSRGICAAYELLDIRSGRRDNSSCLVYDMINGAYRYKALDNNAVKDRTLKGVNSDISVYAGTEGGPYFVVEGLFDMLTLMELDSSLNVISLNGVGNREKAVKYIQENGIYRVVLVLDNDKAGKKRDTADKIPEVLQACNAVNSIDLIPKDVKDINELLMRNRRDILKELIARSLERVMIDQNSIASALVREEFFRRILERKIHYKTGFAFTDDDKVGGLQGLVTIGGVTGLGKTTLVINMLFELLKEHPVVFILWK